MSLSKRFELHHDENLSVLHLLDMFREGLSDKYEVYSREAPAKKLAERLYGTDGIFIIVKQTSLAGASVGVIQKSGKTFLHVGRYPPSMLVQVLAGYLGMALSKQVYNDVVDFVVSSGIGKHCDDT